MARRRRTGLSGPPEEHRAEFHRLDKLITQKEKDISDALRDHECFKAVTSFIGWSDLHGRMEVHASDLRDRDIKNRTRKFFDDRGRLFTRVSGCIVRKW